MFSNPSLQKIDVRRPNSGEEGFLTPQTPFEVTGARVYSLQ